MEGMKVVSSSPINPGPSLHKLQPLDAGLRPAGLLFENAPKCLRNEGGVRSVKLQRYAAAVVVVIALMATAMRVPPNTSNYSEGSGNGRPSWRISSKNDMDDFIDVLERFDFCRALRHRAMWAQLGFAIVDWVGDVSQPAGCEKLTKAKLE